MYVYIKYMCVHVFDVNIRYSYGSMMELMLYNVVSSFCCVFWIWIIVKYCWFDYDLKWTKIFGWSCLLPCPKGNYYIYEKKNENIIWKKGKENKESCPKKVIKEGKERCGQNFSNEVI